MSKIGKTGPMVIQRVENRNKTGRTCLTCQYHSNKAGDKVYCKAKGKHVSLYHGVRCGYRDIKRLLDMISNRRKKV